jgi:hypothetical protein
MVISFFLISGCDHRGLMARDQSRLSPGRSERQRPGKRKIGGDLQGEPIFCLRGPAAALACQSKGRLVAGSKREVIDLD